MLSSFGQFPKLKNNLESLWLDENMLLETTKSFLKKIAEMKEMKGIDLWVWYYNNYYL